MLRKSTLREIRQSLGRYLAILAIVGLGVGFFSGLKVTKADMIQTADRYLEDHKLYDYVMMSTIGYDEDSVAAIAAAEGVRAAEGSVSKDILVEGEHGATPVVHFMSLTDRVNTLRLKAGRLPENGKECVVDADQFGKDAIGQKLVLADANEKEDLDTFRHKEYEIVGVANSPLYINFERGSSEIGNGTVDGFAAIAPEGFDADYFTEVYVTLEDDAAAYSQEYDDAVDRAEDTMKAAGKAAVKARYDDIVAEAQEKLDKQKKKYQDGVDEFEAEKEDVYGELAAALAEIEQGEKDIAKNEKELKKGRKELKANEKTLAKNQKAAAKNRKKLEANQAKLDAGAEELAKQKAQLEAGKAYMPEAAYQQAAAQLAAAEKELAKNQKALSRGFAQLEAGEKKLAKGAKQLAAGKKKLAKGAKELAKGKKQLADGRRQYEEGKAEADEEFAKAQAKLDDAAKKLAKAERKIRKIKKGKSYVYGREINIGYSTFESNASIVESVAKVFPVFFFLVAALVCMTTMTRMIDEQRTQIGVLKALGYRNRDVLAKYMFYSGSAAFIGAIIGFFAGCRVFPVVIWHAYGMMLNFADLPVGYVVDLPLLGISLAVALLCSMGATWLSCSADFREAPAQLIRPKAPASGKRILLERIGPLWSRISFLYKVSLRNIFRYKKRFFMMVVGISGCTALLIAGFGISTSVKNIAKFQYTEIAKYDYTVSFDNAMDEKEQGEFLEFAGDHVGEALFLHMNGADVTAGGKTNTATLIASGEENFHRFLDLHDGERPVDFPGDGEAVVCRKFRDHYGVEIGDTITVKEGSHQAEFTVSGICDNYVYNYVYISDSSYEAGFGKAPPAKTAWVIAPHDSETEPDAVRADAAYCAGHEDVSNVSVNADMVDRVEDMMVSLNAVVLAVILSAALLAFIVLYNLTNINITERIREIATIKVLGFYAGETSAYVFRENFFLTGISALVGIPLGKLLLDFVISNIKVDMIFFVSRVTRMDYLYSVLLTFAFAALVALVMFRRLDKVSMTESLKSIE